jgi:hypothetical protein
MPILITTQQVPVYPLEPDEVTGNKYLEYIIMEANYEGNLDRYDALYT